MPPMLSVFLAPGDYFVGDAHHRVHTLLGSCVSITLWEPLRRLGAMSHFLLAERGGAPRYRPALGEGGRYHAAAPTNPASPLDGRYGVEALSLMLAELADLGVSARDCEAKIFGGGDMFPGHRRAAGMNVGQRNGDAARAMLQARGIRVVSHSLFGVGHRKIVFDVATGDVWARQEDTSGSDSVFMSTTSSPTDLQPGLDTPPPGARPGAFAR